MLVPSGAGTPRGSTRQAGGKSPEGRHPKARRDANAGALGTIPGYQPSPMGAALFRETVALQSCAALTESRSQLVPVGVAFAEAPGRYIALQGSAFGAGHTQGFHALDFAVAPARLLRNGWPRAMTLLDRVPRAAGNRPCLSEGVTTGSSA